MTTSDPRLALDVAREFVRAVEAKDLGAVAATLAPDVRQLFVQSRRTATPEGVADIVAGRRRGLCVADVKGRAEVLAYTEGLFDKFTPLVWRDHEWIVSARRVFFRGKGDMVVARTGKPYRNSYVIGFDVRDGTIVRMTEHGDALRYAALGVRPNGAEFRALLRAAGHLFSPVRSSRSGG